MHLLLVDDDVATGHAMKRVLRGYSVTYVSSVPAAQQVLLSGDPVDLVISDVMMPDMPGSELYKWVKEFRPELADRFIFVTGGIFDPEVARYLAQTGVTILTKPVEIPDLLQTIQEKLGPSDPGPKEG